MTDEQETLYQESKFLLSGYGREPTTLIQTIDYIRELRKVADEQRAGDSYDPVGDTRALYDAFNAKADEVETDMEKRIGWR